MSRALKAVAIVALPTVMLLGSGLFVIWAQDGAVRAHEARCMELRSLRHDLKQAIDSDSFKTRSESDRAEMYDMLHGTRRMMSEQGCGTN